MENLETGDKVKWIEPMMCVPHPEGKTDRNGVVLPVFRNTERTGIVMRGNSFSNVATVRPDGMNLPKDMPTYYDKQVKSENLIKI
tara:strand:+ start:322 stop:576 length:255 start_codon:yes stop_codon:yes gene_type:complete